MNEDDWKNKQAEDGEEFDTYIDDLATVYTPDSHFASENEYFIEGTLSTGAYFKGDIDTLRILFKKNPELTLTTRDGLQAQVSRGAISWTLTAEAGECLGMRVYQDRFVGEATL